MTQWHDIFPEMTEGRGWRRTESPFGRLPSSAMSLVSEKVWSMRNDPAGVCCFFETDGPALSVRWLAGKNRGPEPALTACAAAGFDLYCLHRGRWHHAASLFPGPEKVNEVPVFADLTCRNRRWLLYFPLRTEILKLEIGVADGTGFRFLAPHSEMPVVWYGSSIIHGSCASRPGMAIPSQVSRNLNLQIINLGFSGSAKMELGMAELLSGLSARCLIVDALPNMDAEEVRRNMPDFLQTVCSWHPDMPVLFFTDPPRSWHWLYPDKIREHREKYRAAEEIAGSLRKRYPNLYFIDGSGSIGHDREGTVDGIHPNDLGGRRMARFYTAVLQRLLK